MKQGPDDNQKRRQAPDSQARPSMKSIPMEGRARESEKHAAPVEGRARESDKQALPKRGTLPHHPAAPRFNQSIIIFVTMCTKNRRRLLTQDYAHEIIRSSWRDADAWLVGRYVLMPDHIHLFCAPATYPATPLRQWMFRWRAAVTRNWPRPAEKPIWQKDFFDRQLRSGESYSEKWTYVWNNPVRAGLAKYPEEWRCQGDLNYLEWHEPA